MYDMDANFANCDVVESPMLSSSVAFDVIFLRKVQSLKYRHVQNMRDTPKMTTDSHANIIKKNPNSSGI